jgi:carboxymethylenebutenolidase
MCDQDHYDDDLAKYLERSNLSRRDLGTLSLGVGLAWLLPRAADALDVKESEVEIKTPDGTADAYFVHPAAGAHAGVVVWPDVLGLRPAFRAMGKRLAESGYSVLVINPFYRKMKAPTAAKGSATPIPELMPLAQSLNEQSTFTDAKAFIAWLDQQQSVAKNRKIGTQGYCMGGALVMRTAAAVPNRIGAGASFHGGGLVTNSPNSPHLLAPKIKAHMYFGIATNDDMQQPDAKVKLKEAFDAAKNPAEIEVYSMAQHGWCVPDMPAGANGPIYKKDDAEKAWAKLTTLYKSSLA